MSSLVRLIPRPDGEPVVRVKETRSAAVIYLFWPRNEHYPSARAAAQNYMTNCLSQAVEAPRA